MQRYQRYAAQQADLRALYESHGVLHGWYVTRVGAQSVPDSAGYVRTVHRWRIVGIRALDDPAVRPSRPGEEASELLHDRVVEAIRARFRRTDTLALDDLDNPRDHGEPYVESTTWEGRQGLQVDDSGPAMWCGVLLHMTRCSLTTVCSEAIDADPELHPLRTAGVVWDVAPPRYVAPAGDPSSAAHDAARDAAAAAPDVSDRVDLPGPDDC